MSSGAKPRLASAVTAVKAAPKLPPRRYDDADDDDDDDYDSQDDDDYDSADDDDYDSEEDYPPQRGRPPPPSAAGKKPGPVSSGPLPPQRKASTAAPPPSQRKPSSAAPPQSPPQRKPSSAGPPTNSASPTARKPTVPSSPGSRPSIAAGAPVRKPSTVGSTPTPSSPASRKPSASSPISPPSPANRKPSTIAAPVPRAASPVDPMLPASPLGGSGMGGPRPSEAGNPGARRPVAQPQSRPSVASPTQAKKPVQRASSVGPPRPKPVQPPSGPAGPIAGSSSPIKRSISSPSSGVSGAPRPSVAGTAAPQPPVAQKSGAGVPVRRSSAMAAAGQAAMGGALPAQPPGAEPSPAANTGAGGMKVEELELECPRCGLHFDSQRALFIHTSKFCGKETQPASHSNDDEHKGPASYMTFEEVKRYLETDGLEDSEVGNLLLEDIKNNVQHNDLEVRNLRAQLQKKAAERKVEELKKLKAKQQLARATKAKDNADLSDLMALELQQKEKELQAGIQREKIARELKKVKENKLEQLQEEKARNLAMLEKEKEALRRREQGLLEQIKQMEDKIIQRDSQLEQESRDLASAPAKAVVERGKSIKAQQEAMARDHGAKIAALEQRKAQLSDERRRYDEEEKAVQHKEAEQNLSVPPDKLQQAVDSLASESGLRDQAARVAALRQQADQSLAPPFNPATDDDPDAVRDQEMHALRSDKPMKLPMAQDAERLLDQWLGSEHDPSKNPFNTVKVAPSSNDFMSPRLPFAPPSSQPQPKPDPAKSPVPRLSIAKDEMDPSTIRFPSPRAVFDPAAPKLTPPRNEKKVILPGPLDDQDAESSLTSRGKRKNPTLNGPTNAPSGPSAGAPNNGFKRVSMAPTDEPPPQQGNLASARPNGGGNADAGKVLKDLGQLKKRYKDQGGNNRAVLDRIEQMEAEVARDQANNTNNSNNPMANPNNPFQTQSQPPYHQQPSPFQTQQQSPYQPQQSGFQPPMMTSGLMNTGYPPNPYMPPGADLFGNTGAFGQDPYATQFGGPPGMGATMFPQGFTGQQQTMWQAYGQLAALEADNARLQEEEDDLPEGKLHPRLKGIEDDDTLTATGARARPYNVFKKQTGERAEALMRTLASLPNEHKLHKAFEEHVEEVTAMQLEVEKLQRLADLEIAKARILREKEKALQRQEEEEAIEEQRRQARLNRLARSLNPEAPPQLRLPEPYDPEQGFIVHLDYALGLPDRLQSGAETRKARLVYGLYESMRAFGSPASSAWLPCRRLDRAIIVGQGNTAAILSMELPFTGVPFLQGLCLIVEVHAADDSATGNSNKVKFQPAGWGYMRVFDPQTLYRGYHKLTLLSGSFSPAALDSALKARAGLPLPPGKRPLPNGACLCLRLFTPGDVAPELELEDPGDTFDMYVTPMPTPVAAAQRSGMLGGLDTGTMRGTMRLPPSGPPPPRPAPAPFAPMNAPFPGSYNPPNSASALQSIQPPPKPAVPANVPPLELQPPPSATDVGQRRPSLGRRNSGARRNSAGANAGSALPMVPEGGDPTAPQAPQAPVAPVANPTAERAATPAAPAAAAVVSRPDSTDLFIENRVPGGGDVNRGPLKKHNYTPGDGFSVYLDGARGLPDNVTICKATVRVLTAKNMLIGDEVVTYSGVEGRRACPHFSAFAEYRADTFDPTATLLVRVDTVEVSSKRVVGVGYAVLNVFIDNHAPDPVNVPWPTNPTTQDVQLNCGAFQVPLHQGPPNLKLDFNGGSLQNIKRVPCASVLVRVLPAAPTEDGLSILDRDDVPRDEWELRGVYLPAPSYGQGRYDTTRCAPSEIEKVLYQRRERKENAYQANTLQVCIIEAFKDDGPASLTTEALNEWMISRLAPKPTEMLDLSQLLRYQPDLGFRLAIDGLCNMPAPGLLAPPKLYKVVYCLSPPALYFHDPPLTDDAYMTRTYDLESSLTAPVFLDGYQTFKNAAYDITTVMLFEVRSIKQDKVQQSLVETAGDGYWSALPIFKANYVNSGAFQIPLFKGAVPQAILSASNVYEKICELLKANADMPKNAPKAVELSDGGSMAVRLTDPLLEEYTDPVPFLSVDGARGKKKTALIRSVCDAAGANTFQFDSRPYSDKTLRKAIPKRVDEALYLKDANVKLAAATRITHYVF